MTLYDLLEHFKNWFNNPFSDSDDNDVNGVSSGVDTQRSKRPAPSRKQATGRYAAAQGEIVVDSRGAYLKRKPKTRRTLPRSSGLPRIPGGLGALIQFGTQVQVHILKTLQDSHHYSWSSPENLSNTHKLDLTYYQNWSQVHLFSDFPYKPPTSGRLAPNDNSLLLNKRELTGGVLFDGPTGDFDSWDDNSSILGPPVNVSDENPQNFNACAWPIHYAIVRPQAKTGTAASKMSTEEMENFVKHLGINDIDFVKSEMQKPLSDIRIKYRKPANELWSAGTFTQDNRVYFDDAISKLYKWYALNDSPCSDGFGFTQMRNRPTNRAYFKVPDWWAGTKNDYAKRVAKYLNNGRWLVWAAEAARVCSGLTATNDWKKYCYAWGIGVASPQKILVSKIKLGIWAPMAGDYENELGTSKLFAEYCIKYLISQQPIPAQTFNPIQKTKRTLADWPVRADRARPPVSWPSQWVGTITMIRETAAQAKAARDAKWMKRAFLMVKIFVAIARAIITFGTSIPGTIADFASQSIGEIMKNAGGFILEHAAAAFLKNSRAIFSRVSDEVLGVDITTYAQKFGTNQLIEGFNNLAEQLDAIDTEITEIIDIEKWEYAEDLYGSIVPGSANPGGTLGANIDELNNSAD